MGEEPQAGGPALGPAEVLGVVEFGRRLIESGDLDPVYIALAGCALPRPQLSRWLLAYWSFYHPGVASALSERQGASFWAGMVEADVGRWPRGRERRHFRGANSAKAIAWMASTFLRPESAIEFLTAAPYRPGRPRSLPFAELSARIQAWPAFGPWIAFKAGDMIERLGVADVRFDGADVALYDEPAAGARLAAPELGVEPRLAAVCMELAAALSPLLAPPRYDRPVGLQEVETVLCKWKAHRAGRYPVGLDTRELLHALETSGRWGETADRFRAALPGEVA